MVTFVPSLGRQHGFSARNFSELAENSGRGPGSSIQRMCPFCGLITPRSKPFCLECGKSFEAFNWGGKKQGKNEQFDK